jgi:hypothetical protein
VSLPRAQPIRTKPGLPSPMPCCRIQGLCDTCGYTTSTPNSLVRVTNKADRYLLASYRIATAPEPNSSRLTSFKSTHFDSPANNVGP